MWDWRRPIFLAGIIGLGVLCTLAAQAAPTSVGYFGRLTFDTGAPYTGTVTINVRLYNVPTGGSSIWGPQTFESVVVEDGLLSLDLGGGSPAGFDAALQSSDDLWLQFEVAGVVMSGRQQLLSTAFSRIAANATELGGSPASSYLQTAQLATEAGAAGFVNAADTTLPLTPSGTASDSTFLRGDGTWAPVPLVAWTQSGVDVTYTGGNVGVGTASPESALDVAGEVRLGSSGVPCTATNEGALRYNSTARVMEYCDGESDWQPFGTGSGGGGNISIGGGAVGQVVHITDSTGHTTASNTYVDTGIQATITPSRANSTILVQVTGTGHSATNQTALFTLYEGATNLAPNGDHFSLVQNNVVYFPATFAFSHVASPNTTSPVTYRLRYRAQYAGAGNAYLNRRDFEGTTMGSTQLTLMELLPPYGGNIITDGSGRHWADETYAANCNEYRNPPQGYTYGGAIGDGVYTIDPDGPGGSDAFDAWCDMTSNEGGWTLCLSDVPLGKGTALTDTNDWWVTTWDKGSRVLTRGNRDQGTHWGNFCKLLAGSSSQVYATIFAENNALAVGDMCNFNPSWFTPNVGHTPLSCTGATVMTAIPKDGFQDLGCTGCIYWDNQTTPNTSGTIWGHNYYGTHVMVKLQGQSAYGPSGIHWGNVNAGMSAGNGGDVHCGSNNAWCYEEYWYSTIWKKSMQLYLR